LRVRAVTAGDHQETDDVSDIVAPAERGPIRALLFAPVVTWPTVFVRRALEADPAFNVVSLQRVTKTAAVRAGAPPAALTRADLEPYEVLLCGTLDLDAASRDAVQWFVERRGGVAVFVPDRVPAPTPLLAGISFEPRVVEAAIPLRGALAELTASELAVPRGLPPLSTSLAADAGGTPIVVAWRRGSGAMIVSGALDAWRHRDATGFARFWPAAIAAQAIATLPRLDVAVAPPVVRPGDAVRISAVMRETEIPSGVDVIALPPASARAVSPSAHVDVPVRLWPAAAPGRYEGEWRPAAAGDYAIDVSVGSLTAAAVVTVDGGAAPPGAIADRAAIAADATGGGVFPDEGALATAMAARFPRRTTWEPGHPARSAWWAVAFAVLLCAEWALRRRRGLA
jgi:hypothetical protein